MRRKLIATLAAFVIIAAGGFGAVEKRTYTNLNADKSPETLMQFRVAEIPEELALNTVERMKTELDDSAYIVRVKAQGIYEALFYVNRQAVQVQEVYHGVELLPGDEIWIASERWSFSFDDQDGRTANTGFINALNEGEEYLVFLSEKIEPLQKEERAVYRMNEAFLMVPVFSYTEHDNKIVPVFGETTYVDYADVADNEFFTTTEAGMNAILEFKQDLLERYPSK